MKPARSSSLERVQSLHKLGGSALLAVFWAVIVLTMAVASWFFWLQQRLQLHGEETRGVEALAMAHSGISLALHSKVDRYSSLLQAEVAPGVGYRVTIEGEGGRLNLKTILTVLLNRNDPQNREMRSFFERWLQFVVGVNPLEMDRLVSCLIDYVDEDNIALLNGQEDNKDYHPANRMIQSLDELRRIPGMEPLLAYPGWEELLTLEGDNLLDLLEAPEELLRQLPGFGEAQVQRWLQMRSGPDQIWHTEDDYKAKDVQQTLTAIGIAQAFTGASPQPSAGRRTPAGGDGQNATPFLPRYLIVGGQTIRIRSEGYSGKVVRQVQVVVRKTGDSSQIKSWIE